MFRELQQINERPAVFCQRTTAALWTDPHVSEQMLRHHLDGSVAMSSQTTEFIDASTAWMCEEFGLTSRARVLDLGCGPGLYTLRLARAGADVTGVDFSSRSIAYARDAAAPENLPVTYVNADYLAWESAARFDLVVMIMRDYCALGPDDRATLLRNIESMLEPEGAFVFDVDSVVAMEGLAESASYGPSPSGGFWSPDPYFEFHDRFIYPDDKATLDKFVVIEAGRTRTIYNWIQYFSRESLDDELGRSGLEAMSVYGDVTGRPFDAQSPEFAVVARREAAPSGH